MTYEDTTPREKTISRALAGGMHAGFVLLLVFGVSWQQRHVEPSAVVDLWSSLPAPRPEVAPPPPPPPPKPLPKEEPKLVPKPEPKPPPKPDAKPVPKAEIALKEKLEKERKLKEQQELEKKKQRDLERRKEEEAKKLKARELEAKNKEDEKRKLDKERLAQEAEVKRQAADKQALADKLAKEHAAAQSRLYDEYSRRISDKIKRYIVEPPNLQGNPQVVFELRLLPGGEVLEASLRLKSSSGNPAYDQAVERAILKASPLPLPPDPSMFNMFRELNLKIRPKE
ncbi:MAG: TonB C-terminal domain-containing protein [Burkholderiales bacterium]